MEYHNFERLVTRRIGEKTIFVDIKTNAIYEVEDQLAQLVDAVKNNGGVADLPALEKTLNKNAKVIQNELLTLNNFLGS